MLALQSGVDMIELDVQLSADGELVVIHDYELQRTTDGKGAVRSQSMKALKQLDAGSWFSSEFADERLLTLTDVLEIVADRARLNVEVKPTPGDEVEVAEALIRSLRRFGKLESTVVSCFDFDVLRTLRQREGALPLGLLTHDPDFSNAGRVARELKARSVHPYWALVTSELMAMAREEGLQVIAWTVNDVDVMEALIEQGVDGIISDYPDRFRQVGARRSS